MKKILYVSLMGVFVAATVVAQTNQTHQPLPKKYASVDIVPASKPTASVMANAAKGTSFWTDDFSAPANWTFDNTSSPNPLDWEIINNINASPVAALNPIGLTSAANGFAFINGDPEGEGSVQNANITSANSIDCSAFSNISLTFEQVSRNFQTTYTVLFSIDGGTTWISVPVNTDLAVNTNTANPGVVNLNVSSIIGNQPNVRIRFNFTANWGWFWAIDNVALIQTPSNDIALLSAYFDEYILIGQDVDFVDVDYIPNMEYSSYRQGQVRPLTFIGEVSNQGSEAQTGVVVTITFTPPSGPAQTWTTTPAAIAVGEIAVLTVPNITPASFAGGGTLGDYAVSFTVTGDQTDAFPSNNGPINKAFSVNTEYMANDRGTAWTTFYPTLGQDVIWGNRFAYEQADDVNFIQFAIISTTQAPTLAGEVVYLNMSSGSVFEDEGPNNVMTRYFAGDEIEYITEEAGFSSVNEVNWITMMLPSTVAVSPGVVYQAELEVPAGGSEYLWMPFSNNQESIASTLYIYYDLSSGPQGWWSLGANVPSLRLGKTSGVGIGEPSDLNFKLGQNYPNPSNGNTRIDWELLVPAKNVQFTISDVTGKTVYAKDLGDRPAGVQEPIELNLNLAAGNYQYGLTIGNERIVRKMVLTK